MWGRTVSSCWDSSPILSTHFWHSEMNCWVVLVINAATNTHNRTRLPFSSRRHMCSYARMSSGCLTDQQVWFPVDFRETFSRKFSRICSFIDIYRAWSLTPGITLILFTQAIAQLKDIYRGLIAPISINPGLLQDVLMVHCEVQEFWVSQKISRRLLISSRFPGLPGGKNYSSNFQDFQEC